MINNYMMFYNFEWLTPYYRHNIWCEWHKSAVGEKEKDKNIQTVGKMFYRRVQLPWSTYPDKLFLRTRLCINVGVSVQRYSTLHYHSWLYIYSFMKKLPEYCFDTITAVEDFIIIIFFFQVGSRSIIICTNAFKKKGATPFQKFTTGDTVNVIYMH